MSDSYQASECLGRPIDLEVASRLSNQYVQQYSESNDDYSTVPPPPIPASDQGEMPEIVPVTNNERNVKTEEEEIKPPPPPKRQKKRKKSSEDSDDEFIPSDDAEDEDDSEMSSDDENEDEEDEDLPEEDSDESDLAPEDPTNHPKTAYQFFQKLNKHKVEEAYPNAPLYQIKSLLTKMWRSLPEDQKAYYKRMHYDSKIKKRKVKEDIIYVNGNANGAQHPNTAPVVQPNNYYNYQRYVAHFGVPISSIPGISSMQMRGVQTMQNIPSLQGYQGLPGIHRMPNISGVPGVAMQPISGLPVQASNLATALPMTNFRVPISNFSLPQVSSELPLPSDTVILPQVQPSISQQLPPTVPPNPVSEPPIPVIKMVPINGISPVSSAPTTLPQISPQAKEIHPQSTAPELSISESRTHRRSAGSRLNEITAELQKTPEQYDAEIEAEYDEQNRKKKRKLNSDVNAIMDSNNMAHQIPAIMPEDPAMIAPEDFYCLICKKWVDNLDKKVFCSNCEKCYHLSCVGLSEVPKAGTNWCCPDGYGCKTLPQISPH